MIITFSERARGKANVISHWHCHPARRKRQSLPPKPVETMWRFKQWDSWDEGQKTLYNQETAGICVRPNG